MSSSAPPNGGVPPAAASSGNSGGGGGGGGNSNIDSDSLGGLMSKNSGGLIQGAVIGAVFFWGPSLNWWQWLLICFVGFVLMLYFKQSTMLYARCPPNMPKTPADNPPTFKSPSEHNIKHEDVYMLTPDGCKIHAWFMMHDEPRTVPTVIFFHGNAGNIGYRLPLLKELFEKGRMNILAVDYRGYGFSNGEPSEDGLKVDANTALDWLLQRPDVDPEKVIVFGKSLGGAVAVALAVERRQHVRGLILENTYTNILNLSQDLFPLIKPIKCALPYLLHNKWDTVGIIEELDVPIQFISGKQDNIIKPKHMKDLCAAAMRRNAHNVSFASLQGGHNNVPLVSGRVYQETVNQFLQQFSDGTNDGGEADDASSDSSFGNSGEGPAGGGEPGAQAADNTGTGQADARTEQSEQKLRQKKEN